MAAPFRVQRSQIKFPIKALNPVALTWNKAVLIWGGYDRENDQDLCTSVVYYHKFGAWAKKETSGDTPQLVSDYATAQVINDKMFVVGTLKNGLYDFVMYYQLCSRGRGDQLNCRNHCMGSRFKTFI